MNDLQKLLNGFIKNPEDPDINFQLGNYYFSIDQTASAVSYYIRTSERTEDQKLAYTCLLAAANCFDLQGCRSNSVRGMLKNAISMLPSRPEGYFLLSRFYEREKNYQDSYLIASIGEKICDKNCESLEIDVGYPGFYGIVFEKAVSAWHCGLCDESCTLHQKLKTEYHIDTIHMQAVDSNIERLFKGRIKNENYVWHDPIPYDKEKLNSLRYKFSGSENIEKNYAQVYQDLFVLSMLNGKRNGCFLEIGGSRPYFGNNTALLEEGFGWCGVSIEFNEEFSKQYREARKKTSTICADATKIDYSQLINEYYKDEVIDYLQLDIDPPDATYEALLKIPFDKYKFRVITYEHDFYNSNYKSYREKSREYLKSKGYVMVVGDISPDDKTPFEDWWVHPDFVDENILNMMSDKSDKINKVDDYMFSGDYYAEFETDRYIRTKFFSDFSYQGTMVEVGAGPPTFISSSKHFRNNGWRTICVDPNPKFVEQHQKEGSEIYQYACYNKNGKSKFTVNLNNDDWYSEENDGVSFSSLGIRYEGVPKHNTQETIEVKTIKLDTLLKKIDAKSIDILSIDVEGWEMEVLQGFNHVKYKPKVIVLENYQNKLDYEKYMNDIGYEKDVNLGYNQVYVRIKDEE